MQMKIFVQFLSFKDNLCLQFSSPLKQCALKQCSPTILTHITAAGQCSLTAPTPITAAEQCSLTVPTPITAAEQCSLTVPTPITAFLSRMNADAFLARLHRHPGYKRLKKFLRARRQSLQRRMVRIVVCCCFLFLLPLYCCCCKFSFED